MSIKVFIKKDTSKSVTLKCPSCLRNDVEIMEEITTRQMQAVVSFNPETKELDYMHYTVEDYHDNYSEPRYFCTECHEEFSLETLLGAQK
ncbi:MAG: hypothetical protein ACTSQA_01140 [Candidatus Heimdallarchaeaceae archaeon]